MSLVIFQKYFSINLSYNHNRITEKDRSILYIILFLVQIRNAFFDIFPRLEEIGTGHLSPTYSETEKIRRGKQSFPG